MLTKEDISEALDIINSYREAVGLPTLDDFHEDCYPQDPQCCILAKAFNYDSTVFEGIDTEDLVSGWALRIVMPSEREVKAFQAWASKQHLAVDEDEDYVHLPDELGKIAQGFDADDPLLIKYVDESYIINQISSQEHVIKTQKSLGTPDLRTLAFYEEQLAKLEDKLVDLREAKKAS